MLCRGGELFRGSSPLIVNKPLVCQRGIYPAACKSKICGQPTAIVHYFPSGQRQSKAGAGASKGTFMNLSLSGAPSIAVQHQILQHAEILHGLRVITLTPIPQQVFLHAQEAIDLARGDVALVRAQRIGPNIALGLRIKQHTRRDQRFQLMLIKRQLRRAARVGG